MKKAFARSTAFLFVLLSSAASYAQAGGPIGAAAPPAETKALVTAPKAPGDAPEIVKPASDETNMNLSGGGLITTGNSKTVALTLNGQADLRRGDNAILFGLLGNYGESTVGTNPSTATAQSIQAKLRYDRYLAERLAAFLLVTGRHDRFQGIGFRLNLDPGLKIVAYKDEAQSFWGEVGYDFQFDSRNDAGGQPLGTDGKPLPAGSPLLAPTRRDHSARAFLGYRRNFNASVSFSTGVELLQSFVTTDLGAADTRVNFDANLAAKLDFGFSLGIGFSGRYDRLPIPGRKDLDTTTTISLIYAWNDSKPKKACPECPVCPPPVAAPPAPSPAPSSAAPLPAGSLPAAAPVEPPVAPAPGPGTAPQPTSAP